MFGACDACGSAFHECECDTTTGYTITDVIAFMKDQYTKDTKLVSVHCPGSKLVIKTSVDETTWLWSDGRFHYVTAE